MHQTALHLCTTGHSQVVDLTNEIREFVAHSGMINGLCVVYCPHTTAGITINEGYDPDVTVDAQAALERIAPWLAGSRHAEGNAAAHIKAMLLGCQQTVVVRERDLQLGQWQAVQFYEFDGPRNRTVTVTLLTDETKDGKQ